jgi:double-strand break repair protein MRE11
VILRKYVMGSNPVRVQVLSDQHAHFGRGGPFNRVNWEDPHFNIGVSRQNASTCNRGKRNPALLLMPLYNFAQSELPIFTIHGNHDDPSREVGAAVTDGATDGSAAESGQGGAPSGRGLELLSAVDILAAANLVNYFGAVEDASSGE